MTAIPPEVANQIAATYLVMATSVSYRPEVPGDMVGAVDPGRTIDEEAESYAARWWREEDTGDFHLGSCDHETRPAAIYALEAIRLLNTGTFGRTHALRLLALALQELIWQEVPE